MIIINDKAKKHLMQVCQVNGNSDMNRLAIHV